MGWYDNSIENQNRRDYAGGLEEFGQLQAPHWYSGLLGAVPRGIAGAVVKTGSAYNAMLEKAGIDQSEWGVEPDKEWENYSKPDPRWQSATSQIAQGVTEGLGLAVVGTAAAGGNPLGGAALLGGVEGHALYQDLREKDVDPNTALGAAVASGVFNAAGVLMPGTAKPVAEWLTKMSVGATLAGKEAAANALMTGAEQMAKLVGNAKGTIGFGVGANVAMGVAQRGLTGEILRSNGYDQMAEQFRAFDMQSMAADVILGAAFGGLTHMLEGRPAKPNVSIADIDAAMAIIKHEQYVRGGPGIPTNPLAADLHDELFRGGVEDTFFNRPINIPEDKAQALADNVAPDPITDALYAARHDAVVEIHNVGDLLQTPVKAPHVEEPVLEPAVEKVAPEPKPAPAPKAEGSQVEMDVRMRETLNQLVQRNPDMKLLVGDKEVLMSELPAMLEKNLQDAQKDSALIDVAASCFIQTLGSIIK